MSPPDLQPAEKRKLQLKEWIKYDKIQSKSDLLASSSLKRSSTSSNSTSTKNSKKVCFDKNAVFMAACQAGDLTEVENLLASGQDINCCNTDGLTALHTACIDGNFQVSCFLVNNNADVNAKDNEGWSPLHAAAGSRDVKIVSYLIGKNANVEAINCDGELALDVADDDGCIQLLEKALIKNGNSSEDAKQNLRTIEEEKMLEHAKQLKSLNLKKPVTDPRKHPKTKATMAHVACAKGYIRVLKVLLQEVGLDIEAKDIDGWTPLHAAAHWEEAEAVEVLYQLGANFLAENNSRQLPVDILPVEDDYCRPNPVYQLVQNYTVEAKRKKMEKDELTKKKTADKKRLEEEKKLAMKEEEKRKFQQSKHVKIKDEDDESRRTSKVMVPKTKNEAEVQRAVKAKRERQTRRATQGVTLDSLQKGKQLYHERQLSTGTSITPEKTSEPPEMSSTPTGYIPKSERNQKDHLAHTDSFGLTLKDPKLSSKKEKIESSKDAIVPDLNDSKSEVNQAEEVEKLKQEDEAKHRARNDANRKRRARSARNPTGIFGGALSHNIEDNAEDNAKSHVVVTEEKMLINSESRNSIINEIARKNSLEAGDRKKYSAGLDWKHKYETEKAAKEKLEKVMESVNQRLGKVLSNISVSSQNGVVHTAHRDIVKTLDLLELEVDGQSGEIRSLNMDRLALTRVLAKLRLLDN